MTVIFLFFSSVPFLRNILIIVSCLTLYQSQSDTHIDQTAYCKRSMVTWQHISQGLEIFHSSKLLNTHHRLRVTLVRQHADISANRNLQCVLYQVGDQLDILALFLWNHEDHLIWQVC